MIGNILLVYPDAEENYYEVLRDTLEEGFRDDGAEVMVERNVARARQRLQGRIRFDLVVSHIELQPEPLSPPDPRAGLALEDWLRSNKIAIPMIIVVPKYDNEVAKRVSHPLSLVMENDRSLGDSVIKFARDRTPPERQLNIVLNLLAKSASSGWHYTIKGKNFPELREYNGTLKQPDNSELGTILQFTNDIDNAQTLDWEKRVDLLSTNLYRILISNNDQFRMDLREALGGVSKLEQTRVQFVVDEKVYPVLLEAVQSPDELDSGCGGDYWMVHSPLVRHVSDRRTGHTLFQEEERRPINVLLIGSNTSGPVKLGRSNDCIRLHQLTNVEPECNELKQHLDKLKDERNINLGEIRILPPRSEGRVVTGDVKHALEEKRWDIVHYAGHSYFDEESHRAYVFFKDSEDYVDPVEIEIFAGYLRETRLLVLSSCTSSHKGFVFELARHQVPAVLGFRARIEDDLARRFSADFFSSLFELRSVDGAFFQARKHLYEADDTDRAWTNPVLVLESVA